jgi:hypothetical protein
MFKTGRETKFHRSGPFYPWVSSSPWNNAPVFTYECYRIGQKLSERVESFHFTHAINSFRVMINGEMRTGPVKQHLRPDFGGIMVLPVSLANISQGVNLL